ncbi:MAG: EAL domain-containing protein [Phyllobacterium sp.]
MTVEYLKGWRLAVTLGPELSQPALWCWKHTLALIGGLLLSIMLAAIAAAHVVHPLRRLSRAVTDVGNLSLDAPVAVRTRIREIGLLAATIERMRKMLRTNQARLEFLAYHDPASGFLNQSGLMRSYSLQQARPGQLDLILIKVRNYHHIASIMGEAILARIVSRNIGAIQEELEDSAVGCINDNQIACLYSSKDGLDIAQMQKLLDRMRVPYEVDGVRVNADICASVSTRQHQTDRFDMLLRRANGALHHAEETRSDDAVWYNPVIIQDLREALEFGGDIAQAIARGEFFVRFQPIVELRSGRIEAAHASISWRHPDLGILKGRKFIPIFERNGSIRHIGLFVISQTFEFLHHFKRRSPGRSLQVGINLSYAQLLDPLFIERVTELQKEWGIQATEIRFVITQSAALLEDQQILRTMRKLRKLGFHLCIDQFAMAYAVVTALTAIRYDSLMVGSNLQQGIDHPGVERTIFQSVCGLAAKLGMQSIAVGIDRHAIIAPLVECGCTHGMGPWFGKAAAEPEFLGIYAENAALFVPPHGGYFEAKRG